MRAPEARVVAPRVLFSSSVLVSGRQWSSVNAAVGVVGVFQAGLGCAARAAAGAGRNGASVRAGCVRLVVETAVPRGRGRVVVAAERVGIVVGAVVGRAVLGRDL